MKSVLTGFASLAITTAFMTAIMTGCSALPETTCPETTDKENIVSIARKPIVIAHRGYRAIVPENTLEAARAGYAAGAEMWELDVAASSDGVLVVLHDDTLTRTTDAETVFPDRSPWSVYDFTMTEIEGLDAGSWYGKADPFRQIASGRVGSSDLESFIGLGIPTLESCLLLTKELGWSVNVEIKDAAGQSCAADIVEKTVALVEGLNMEASVLISSFNHEYLRRAKKAAPGIATAALTDNSIPDIVGRLREIGALAWHPNGKKLDEATARSVRAAGFDLNVWTVNEEPDMRRFVSWGATGLITDFTERARRVSDLTKP